MGVCVGGLKSIGYRSGGGKETREQKNDKLNSSIAAASCFSKLHGLPHSPVYSKGAAADMHAGFCTNRYSRGNPCVPQGQRTPRSP